MKRREPVSTRVCLSPSPDPCLPRQETQEMRVSSLGWEDTLEEGIATHFSILGLPWWLRQERICLQCRRPWFYSWVRKICWRRNRLPSPVFLGFPGGLDGKESACDVGDLGLFSGLGRSTGGEHSNPLQYSCLENPHRQRGAWQATVHRVTYHIALVIMSHCVTLFLFVIVSQDSL